MQPRIETLAPKKLIGKRVSMTVSNNQTFKLWLSFMPKRKEIKNNLTNDLFSLQVYPPSFDFTFSNPDAAFEKWAALEVPDFSFVPEGLETFDLASGLYAVLEYKGLSSDPKIFKYIFGVWLPKSNNYTLDDRAHFEILGDKYQNNNPDSEEEIWIPIKLKE